MPVIWIILCVAAAILAVLADFPEYAQPKMYIGAGLIHDNFEAMKNMAFDLVLDNI